MASEDLNVLHNEARGFAECMLLAHGEFIPFGVSMSSDGNITHVAGNLGTEYPQSAEMVEFLQSCFARAATRGDIRAAGVCLNMYIVPPGEQRKTDAICTRLAHVSGEAVEVFVPYARDRTGTFHLAQPFAVAGREFQLVGS